jgi:hypothetical protein
VAGFFYGNGIECRLAVAFFGLSSQYADTAVTEQIYQLYQHWHVSPWTYHKIEYYNMRLWKHLYLNGKRCRLQEERVVPDSAPLPSVWRVRHSVRGYVTHCNVFDIL